MDSQIGSMDTGTSTDILPYSYGSIGRRFLAVMLDALIVAIPCIAANSVIPILGGIIVLSLYAPVLEASEIRATIGKHLMGLQVVDLSGRRISFRASFIRYLMKIASSMLCFVGHFFALFTQKKQALHDIVADTLVVYGRSERPIVDAWVDSVRALFGQPKLFAASTSEKLAEVERLQALRERGALTEEEFQAQKKAILGN